MPASYQWTDATETIVKRTNDGAVAYIPADLSNQDYADLIATQTPIAAYQASEPDPE
jgi:hypothetical protein